MKSKPIILVYFMTLCFSLFLNGFLISSTCPDEVIYISPFLSNCIYCMQPVFLSGILLLMIIMLPCTFIMLGFVFIVLVLGDRFDISNCNCNSSCLMDMFGTSLIHILYASLGIYSSLNLFDLDNDNVLKYFPFMFNKSSSTKPFFVYDIKGKMHLLECSPSLSVKDFF